MVKNWKLNSAFALVTQKKSQIKNGINILALIFHLAVADLRTISIGL